MLFFYEIQALGEGGEWYAIAQSDSYRAARAIVADLCTVVRNQNKATKYRLVSLQTYWHHYTNYCDGYIGKSRNGELVRKHCYHGDLRTPAKAYSRALWQQGEVEPELPTPGGWDRHDQCGKCGPKERKSLV